MEPKKFSQLLKYQNCIKKNMKNNKYLNETSEETKKIFYELIDNSNHISAVLCLTIMNSQIKNNNFKSLHGYHLASAIDFMEIIANINLNREYYNDKFGNYQIDNAISEVYSFLYILIIDNINTLKSNLERDKNDKTDKIIRKITQKFNEHYIKNMGNIMRKFSINSDDKMIKTDILTLDFDKKYYKIYKRKSRISKQDIKKIVIEKYGSVYVMGICLGWLIGCGNEDKLDELEELSREISTIIKIHDDFMNMERDISKSGNICYNFVINHGAKETFIDFIDYKTNFIEKAMKLKVDTKTTNEILSMVEFNILDSVKDIELDFNSRYDDVSTLSSLSMK